MCATFFELNNKANHFSLVNWPKSEDECSTSKLANEKKLLLKVASKKYFEVQSLTYLY